MYYLLYFFLAAVAVIMFVLAVLTKNFTFSLVSLVVNFGAAYATMAVEVVKYFYDSNASVVVEHVDYVRSIPLAVIFMLFGIASVVYAFFAPFGGEKELKV